MNTVYSNATLQTIIVIQVFLQVALFAAFIRCKQQAAEYKRKQWPRIYGQASISHQPESVQTAITQIVYK
jgi:hypothetical protein